MASYIYSCQHAVKGRRREKEERRREQADAQREGDEFYVWQLFQEEKPRMACINVLNPFVSINFFLRERKNNDIISLFQFCYTLKIEKKYIAIDVLSLQA